MLELVLPISKLKYNSALTHWLLNSPHMHTQSCFLLLQRFTAKTSNANWKDHFEKYPYFPLPFFFLLILYIKTI